MSLESFSPSFGVVDSLLFCEQHVPVVILKSSKAIRPCLAWFDGNPSNIIFDGKKQQLQYELRDKGKQHEATPEVNTCVQFIWQDLMDSQKVTSINPGPAFRF